MLTRIAQNADQGVPSGTFVLNIPNRVFKLVLSETENPLHQGMVYCVGVSQKEVARRLERPYLLRSIAEPGAVCLQPIPFSPSDRKSVV